MKIYIYAIMAIIAVAAGVSALEDFLSPQASYQQSIKPVDHATERTSAPSNKLAYGLTSQERPFLH